jgi:hypothetical protein
VVPSAVVRVSVELRGIGGSRSGGLKVTGSGQKVLMMSSCVRGEDSGEVINLGVS